MNRRTLPAVFRSTGAQATVLAVLAIAVGNVSALVDCVLHPEIPYFDSEHLIVGGITLLVSALLSSLLFRYVRHLSRAADAITRLEAILPICSHCRKVRKSGADPSATESWQSIEAYVTEKTRTEFSHGVCPECMAALYPEHARRLESKRRRDA